MKLLRRKILMNKKEFAKVYKKMSQRDITITKALDKLDFFRNID